MAEASAADRRKVAVHEAGHAAIYEILAGRAVSLATAFRKEDQRGGICYCYKPAGCSSKLWNEVRALGGLGGRAATDLVYGIADEGAADDLRRVANHVGQRMERGVEFGIPNPSIRHFAPEVAAAQAESHPLTTCKAAVSAIAGSAPHRAKHALRTSHGHP